MKDDFPFRDAIKGAVKVAAMLCCVYLVMHGHSVFAAWFLVLAFFV